MMKTTPTLIFLASALFSLLSFGRAKILLPFGTKQKIVHSMDLPNQKAFQMADGRYFNLGSHYEIRHLFWLAYAHSKPEVVGYLSNSDAYVVLTQQELQAINYSTKADVATMAKVRFMDTIGGKLLFGILTCFALYVCYTIHFRKLIARGR